MQPWCGFWSSSVTHSMLDVPWEFSSPYFAINRLRVLIKCCGGLPLRNPQIQPWGRIGLDVWHASVFPQIQIDGRLVQHWSSIHYRQLSIAHDFSFSWITKVMLVDQDCSVTDLLTKLPGSDQMRRKLPFLAEPLKHCRHRTKISGPWGILELVDIGHHWEIELLLGKAWISNSEVSSQPCM